MSKCVFVVERKRAGRREGGEGDGKERNRERKRGKKEIGVLQLLGSVYLASPLPLLSLLPSLPPSPVRWKGPFKNKVT